MAVTKTLEGFAAITAANLADTDLIHAGVPGGEDKSLLVSELKKINKPAPDIVTFTSDLAAGTATFAGEVGQYYRKDNMMYGKIYADVTGAGSADLTLTVPDGLTIDTSFLVDISGQLWSDFLGPVGRWQDAGLYRFAAPVYFSTTSMRFAYEGGGALVGAVLASGDELNFNFHIPILEWA